MSERIEERATSHTYRRMNQHSGRFIENQKKLVLEDDVERKSLRVHRRVSPRVDTDFNEITGLQFIATILVSSIDLAEPVPDDFAQIHPAQLGEPFEQKLIEPLFARGFGYNISEELDHDLEV